MTGNTNGDDLLKKMRTIADTLNADFERYTQRAELATRVETDPEYVQAKADFYQFCSFLDEQKEKAKLKFQAVQNEVTKRVAKEIWPQKEETAE